MSLLDSLRVARFFGRAEQFWYFMAKDGYFLLHEPVYALRGQNCGKQFAIIAVSST